MSRGRPADVRTLFRGTLAVVRNWYGSVIASHGHKGAGRLAHRRRIAIAAATAGLLGLLGPRGAHADRVPAVVLTLPFDGVWGVLQGFDGETHRGYAAYAIDFAPPQDVGAFARLAHPQLR